MNSSLVNPCGQVHRRIQPREYEILEEILVFVAGNENVT